LLIKIRGAIKIGRLYNGDISCIGRLGVADVWMCIYVGGDSDNKNDDYDVDNYNDDVNYDVDDYDDDIDDYIIY
jgi:hypothetical protein